MFVFAIENIIKVFSNQDIWSSNFLSQGLFIGLQYFFLGISAVYIMQNYILLAGFLPSKTGNYKNEFKANINYHIDRFSDKQLYIGNALFCILYAVSLYGFNYQYHVLPRNTMIWFVIFSYALIIQLIEVIVSRKSYENIEISN